jgi:hypothetical protein
MVQMQSIYQLTSHWRLFNEFPGGLRCSPKTVPGDMKVSTGLKQAKRKEKLAQETFDEGQKAYAGTDHRQAA